jgi:D-glycero-alpha-D-manno-heptose-7-phosphate kinase
MTFPYLEKIQFKESETVRTVMAGFSLMAVHTDGSGFGVVTDPAGKCTGVVTDGDIRRKLIEGLSIDAPVSEAMNRDFSFARKNDTPHQVLRLFEKGIKEKRLKRIPVIDDNGKLIDLLLFSDFNATARMKAKLIRARAPVRISFSGGGTDMTYYFKTHSGCVLSSTINKYAYASVRVRNDDRIRLISKDFNIATDFENKHKIHYGDSLDLIKACVKMMDPDFGFDLLTHSEVEPGTGLGGSSAISAAVVGALNSFYNENYLDKYQLADLSYQAERVELGIAGGWQDQYASVFGGLNLIEFRKNDIVVVPLRITNDILLELQFNLLIFRFGETRQSGDIAHDQQKLYKKSDSMFKHYQQLASLTLDIKDALLKGMLNDFGNLMHEGWLIKNKFSKKISNQYIDLLYQSARKAGALGGKVLGAGGGGYLLLFVPPPNQMSVIDAMESQNAVLDRFDFVKTGLQIWTAEGE